MTSCLVSRSISSMRVTSKRARAPFSQITSAASRGIMPISAIAVAACASISNQMRKRVSGSHRRVISGRE
jgi:hypothetical protein